MPQQYPIGLQGEGVASEVMLSTNSFDFGAVVLGEGESGMITLTNIGNQDLEVSDITDPGEPFALGFAGAVGIRGAGLCSVPPFTLTPDQSCAIEVVFNPTTEGMFNTTFDIVSNAPTSPDTAALIGSGIAEDGIFSDRFE